MLHAAGLAFFFLLCTFGVLVGDELRPSGSEPRVPERKPAAPWHSPDPRGHQRGAIAVSVASREEVRNLYNTVYTASTGVPSGSTADVTTCTAGTTTDEYRTALVRRVNYFRAMAGVPAVVTLDDEYTLKAQEAALIMAANIGVTNSPPMSWTCWSEDGDEGALNSMLSLGLHGHTAIDFFMEGAGTKNTRVGNRRWILYPQTEFMGTGAADEPVEAGATWVIEFNFDDPRPATRTPYVAWPPPGFVPYRVVYTRWSFSYPEADFSSAAVTVMHDGA